MTLAVALVCRRALTVAFASDLGESADSAGKSQRSVRLAAVGRLAVGRFTVRRLVAAQIVEGEVVEFLEALGRVGLAVDVGRRGAAEPVARLVVAARRQQGIGVGVVEPGVPEPWLCRPGARCRDCSRSVPAAIGPRSAASI